MKSWKFRDALYPMDYILLMSTPAEAERFLAKEFGQPPRSEWYQGATLFVETATRRAVVLWFRPDTMTVSPSTLAHECFHATSRTLRFMGLELDDGSEEAFAYHLTWLYEQVWTRLTSKSRKTNSRSSSKH